MSDRPITRPSPRVLITESTPPPLSTALMRIKLEIKGLGPDITHGTEFYTPIVTLLARTLTTRRQDLVLQQWPLLGCPFTYFSNALQQGMTQQLSSHLIRTNHMPVMWEVLDLFQSVGKWSLENIIKFVRAAEDEVRGKLGLMDSLQTAADAAVKRHDIEGIRENAPQMNEGIVIPADGFGRIN